MRIVLFFLPFHLFLSTAAWAQAVKLQAYARMGTDGLPGIELVLPIPHSPTWLRMQASFLQVGIADMATDLNGRLSFKLLLDGRASLHHLALWADHPLFGKQWIRACGGIGLFATSELSGKIQLAGNFRFNDIDFTPEEIGYWQGTVLYPIPFAPYAGMALGKLRAGKRFGLSVDMGAYYRLDHRISVEATNLLRGNEERAERLTELTKFLRWIPVISVRTTYRFFNHQIKKS